MFYCDKRDCTAKLKAMFWNIQDNQVLLKCVEILRNFGRISGVNLGDYVLA
jgi:hypothetical protein